MKTLDRYIIRQFVVNFVILTMVFMLLFVLVDFIVDMDEFLSAGELRGMQLKADVSADEAKGLLAEGQKPGLKYMIIGTAWMSAQYYGPMVLLVYVFLSGLLVTGAMGFTFAQMVRAREILAMLASGLSLYRVAVPVVIVGCALNMLTLPIQEWAIPQLVDFYKRKNELSENKEGMAVDFARDRNFNLISARDLDVEKNVIHDVSILVRDEEGHTRKRIVAKSAVWNADRHGWELEGSIVSRVNQTATAAVAETQHEDFFATDLSPHRLRARQASLYARLLSSAELLELQDDPRIPALQIMHSRFSMLVVNVLILIMGIPYFVIRLPTDTLLRSIKAAGICIGAWITALVLMQMSNFNPIAAAWLPVVIYLPVSVGLLQSIKS